MEKKAWVQLILGIVLIGLFLVAWLVFKNIKPFDWVILLLGILDLITFVVSLKQRS